MSMTNKWESRERGTKRIALIVSVLLHVFALALISTGTGKQSFQHLIESVFGNAQQSQGELSETKV